MRRRRLTLILLAILLPFLVLAQAKLEGPPRISENQLVAHWRFDEGSGTSVADMSQYHNNGTFDGAWIRGNYDMAASFNAASENEVTVPDDPSLDMGTSNFTVAIWARITTAAASILCSKYGSVGYFVGLAADGTFYGKVRDASTNVPVLGSYIADGEWHLLVMLADRSDASTGLKLYLDGEYDTAGQLGTGNIDNSENFYIGRLSSGYYLTGDIDDVRIWKRLLTEDEIKRLWDQTKIKVFINGENSDKPIAF